MPIYKLDSSKNGKQGYRVIVNYTDTNGNKKRKSQCVYGKQEARELESELLKSVKENPNAVKITIKELYKEYIKVKAHEVRRSSLTKTKSILENHVLNTPLAKTRLDKLSKRILQDWKNEIAKKDIKVTTKNNAYRELNTLINYALKMDYILKNPLKDIGKFKEPYFTTQEEKIRYYTKEEFDKYIAVAKDTRSTYIDHACYVFFILAFYTGMRKGEINALKWSDLDGNIIHVRRSVSLKNGFDETPPKNESSVRSLKVPRIVLDVLNEHRAIQKKNFDYSEDFRICGGIKPVPDSTLEYHNQLYAEKAGLPHRTIHEFRHSHATFLINSGVNIMEVSHRLGHADVKMTLNTYSHLYPSTEEAAIKALEGRKRLFKIRKKRPKSVQLPVEK